MRIVRIVRLPTLLMMLMARLVAAPVGGLDALSNDGLYTWRVAATDDAPAWCCLRWVNDSPIACGCDLDKREANFGSGDDDMLSGGEVQIYVSVEAGKPDRIRALSPQCEVESKRAITDLGVIDVKESLAWLETRVRRDAKESSHALAAIAMHRGSEAMNYLRELANHGSAPDLREDAIFWMGQVRITESADDLERLMFRDDNPKIREHAAFSLSQSSAPGRGAALIRQGREDDDPDVRSQAWFWLAQTELPESEEAILSAVANDRDEDVREEAVFALSQLPDERGVDALFSVLDDRKLSRDARKQALFWLAQSDSDRAYEYLDRLLTNQ